MAFFLAIGLSFATVELESSSTQVNGWVNGPNGWEQISVDCDGTSNCKVRFLPNPTVYPVYEEASETSEQLDGSGQVIDL